jgi:alkanesulfonate monooxygenase
LLCLFLYSDYRGREQKSYGMSIADIEFGWFIPTVGDGKHVGVPPERKPSLEYAIQVAQAAEAAGFGFALIPTGGACIDAWLVGSAVISRTNKLRPLVAVRPGLVEPVVSARMAAGLDVLSGGRALINVVTGSSAEDLEALGDPLAHDHDARYERAREYLHIMKSVWRQSRGPAITEFTSRETIEQAAGQEKTYFEGKYYRIRGGTCSPPPVQEAPPFYFGGSSPAGKRVAAEFADCYLMWAEPLHMIREQIEELETLRRDFEAKNGVTRRIRYGLRAQVLVRDTEEEAWQEAREIISKVDSTVAEQARKAFAKTDATNQSRQNQIREASAGNGYVVGPNLWAGLSTVRSGGALMFVGTPDQVTDRLLEYVDIGVSSFILSGYPHLEEAQIFGEKAMPLFRRKWEQRQQSNRGIRP